VKDIVPGGSSTPQFLTDIGGTLYFAAYAPSPGQLWRSDGTEAGTVLVSAAAPDPRHLLNYDGTLLFFGRLSTSYGLWRSDGTAEGTTLVKDLGVPIPSLSTTLPALTPMTRAGNSVYFVGKGNELWKSDGTAAGTQLIKVLPSTQTQNATIELSAAGDKLVFAIYKRNSSGETVNLWSSDGTDAGTQQIRTLVAAAASNVTPLYFASVGGVAYLRAGENGSQRRLWRTDGTVEGTVRITSSVDPTQITSAGNRLYYYGSGGGISGGGLYVVDGLGATPVLVRGGVGSSGGLPAGLGGIATMPEGGAFFVDRSTATPQAFRTDGTPAGTQPVMSNASLNTLWVVGRTLFCQVGPDQLWATDGTPGYERLVLTNTAWSPLVPHPIVASGPRAFVMANGATFVELWQLLLPPAPPVVTMDADAPSEVTLHWDNPTTAPGVPVSAFLVERRGDPDSTWSIVGETAQGVTSFADAGLNPNVRYEYRVRAVNAGGPSPASNVVARAGMPAWLAPGSAATWDGTTLTVTGAATLIGDTGPDMPAIVVDGAGAALTIDPDSGSVVRVASLALTNGGRVALAPHGAGAVRTLVVDGVPAVDATSSLDLADNAVVVLNGSATAIQSLVAAAFDRGAWDGVGGITSSAAAADPNGATAVGFAGNSHLGKSTFAGVDGLTASAVFMKYTYYGDADLSGSTTLDDFTLFLHGYQTGGTDWFAGDYDFDGLVTLDDFTLFLRGYQQQGVPL
jgi:ELWxxDGT repeat protein